MSTVPNKPGPPGPPPRAPGPRPGRQAPLGARGEGGAREARQTIRQPSAYPEWASGCRGGLPPGSPAAAGGPRGPLRLPRATWDNRRLGRSYPRVGSHGADWESQPTLEGRAMIAEQNVYCTHTSHVKICLPRMTPVYKIDSKLQKTTVGGAKFR